MRAGRLRHRGTIQQPVRAKAGSLNATTVTWTTVYARVPMGIEPLRGHELVDNAQRQAATDTRIVLRYLPNITHGWRVVDDKTGDIYDIAGIVNENNRNRLLELDCTKGLRDG